MEVYQQKPLPSGLDNVVHGGMLPDVQASFRIFAAHLRKVNAQWSFPEHQHPMFELNLVVDGSQRMRIGDKHFVQKQGDLVWILPNEVHASLGAVEGSMMEYVCVHLEVTDPWFRQQLSQINQIIHPSGSKMESLLRPILMDLAQIARENSSSGLNVKLQTMHASFRIFTALSEVLLDEAEVTTQQTGDSGLAAQLAARIEHQASSLKGQEPFRITRIAKQLGYSPAHCNRVFHKAYGVSPRHYLSTIKLRQAKLMLMDPTLSIEHIADLLGYKDLSQFSKQFKRWTNLSPTAYRHLSW
ncbi:AraC family transcriptional regulator [Paenibacillus qinlingensis]|uniref:AraC-like DNA-binding protein/mannose-6-phosphate isomerase-like protein (Cupin superfamily) n=1 Tax=Paenibacillus qinlingensis TaxID=1837343 RepID=A0ABU1NQX6_9BACL|nr:AraC family transcriptional regulator [Paenibacillus qinlingensis]MDR6549881.1 AraC-like DNA-binding protein/mannose-6-phosphate isomerase-like protein (cupin superfamily) [Paenibacillus qinlingensis]